MTGNITHTPATQFVNQVAVRIPVILLIKSELKSIAGDLIIKLWHTIRFPDGTRNSQTVSVVFQKALELPPPQSSELVGEDIRNSIIPTPKRITP